MTKSTFKYVIYIRTTPEKLWHALTAAEVIKKYWFGMKVETDWEIGSTWKFYQNGRLMDSGEILENVPRKKIVRSWINEWKPELKTEGISHCVSEIEAVGACVKLTITHSMERVNSQFIEAVSQGWPICLSNLKSLLETGEVALAEHPGHGD